MDRLVSARPDRLTGVADGWRRLSQHLAEHADRIEQALANLREAWRGEAAVAATRQIGLVAEALRDAVPALLDVERVLDAHAGTLVMAQRMALAIATGRPEAAATTSAAVTGAQTGTLPVGAVADAVLLAARSDREAADRLAALAPTLFRAPAAPPGPPPPAADPPGVAAWWRGLDPGSQHWFLVNEPGQVGGLDGVPVAARDLANRELLDRARARLAGQESQRAVLAGLDAIAARLDAPGAARGYLLGLSLEGNGRAVVAIGDPDRADDVVTYVPGMTSGLATVRDELSRMDRLRCAAGSAAPDRSAAAIVWLGYDAPGDLIGAARPGAARAAEQSLHRFQEGLRATHLGARSHNTVIGASYGSTVVGFTARDSGLAADDLVLIGSPGVGVGHAGDLGIAPAHVWGSTAAHDVINAAASPSGLLRRFDLNPLLRPLFGEHTDQLWYGASPTGTDFGGREFTSAPGSPAHPIEAHGAYFDPGNPSLANMADIAVGDYADVR